MKSKPIESIPQKSIAQVTQDTLTEIHKGRVEKQNRGKDTSKKRTSTNIKDFFMNSTFNKKKQALDSLLIKQRLNDYKSIYILENEMERLPTQTTSQKV